MRLALALLYHPIVTGLTPTAQWWGVAIKKVPSASAWATADSHSALSSSVRLPRILCFITAMREAWDASTDANCEKQVNPTRPARRKRSYRLASAQPAGGASPPPRAAPLAPPARRG